MDLFKDTFDVLTEDNNHKLALIRELSGCLKNLLKTLTPPLNPIDTAMEAYPKWYWDAVRAIRKIDPDYRTDK